MNQLPQAHAPLEVTEPKEAGSEFLRFVYASTKIIIVAACIQHHVSSLMACLDCVVTSSFIHRNIPCASTIRI